MSKICAWCSALLGGFPGTAIPTSHALCPGCLDELQSALSSNGLREVADAAAAVRPASRPKKLLPPIDMPLA